VLPSGTIATMARHAPTAPSAIVPLLYVWGDDELAAERLVTKFSAALEGRFGAPLERWDLRARLDTADIDAAQLYERLATPAMFGGGTLAVVSNPGALARKNESRDRVLESIRLVAAGNALVIIEASKSNAKGPGLKRFADAVKDGRGSIRAAQAPRPTGLGSWIADEARDRRLNLGPGAARELAERLGARVTEGDVNRRYLSRVAAGELDKLALRHAIDEGPVTPDDVRALVSETTPSSLWAATDAVGDRRVEASATAIDRALETTPEPVLLTILHRRIVELLELGDRVAGGASLAEAARVMGINSEYRAKTLAGQARRWTTDELTAALAGLVELDAMVNGAPGSETDPVQRRLAFMLWVRERVGPG
jgi:DNA polymerase III delta subunit